MKALLIAAFIAVPLIFVVWLLPHLRRAFKEYRENPWKPKPWNDDD